MKRILIILSLTLILLVSSNALAQYDEHNLKYSITVWGNVRPSTSERYSIGDATHTWSKAYLDTIIGAILPSADLDTINTLLILPKVSGTGQIGTASNAFNAAYVDTVNTIILKSLSGAAITINSTDTLKPGTPGILFGTNRLYNNSNVATFSGTCAANALSTSDYTLALNGKNRMWSSFANAWISIYGNNGNPYVWLSDTTANDTTRGWFVGKYVIRGKATGSTIQSDSFKLRDSLFAYLTAGNKRVAASDTLKITEYLLNAGITYTTKISNTVSGAAIYIYPKTTAGALVLGTADSTTTWKLHPTTIIGIAGSTIQSDTAKHDNILPQTTNTGQVGTATNAFNSGYIDSIHAMFGYYLRDSLFAWLTSGNKRNLIADSIYNGVIFGGPDKTYDITFNSGSTFNILQNGNLTWSGATASRLINYTNINKIALTEIGASVVSDTISGYNGNTWAVNSWGITITGVDTLSKFYMSSFDSTKFVRVWGTIKNASSGGSADTLVYKDSLATDSVKIAIPVGSLWLAPSLVNKKWPTNPSGVLNPVYCIFRKGSTTAASNMQFFTSYGMCKGRVF